MLRKHAARMVLIWTMVLLMASPVIAKANIDMVWVIERRWSGGLTTPGHHMNI